MFFFFFFQAEDGIRDYKVTGVQTCALPIYPSGIQDTYTFQIGSVWDGQWHVYRMHAKNSSNPGVSADAAWQVWVDGVKHVDVGNLVDNSTGIWDIDLGANMNQGPAVAGMQDRKSVV